MQQLLNILTDSFVIWSRNFTLMYMILFFSLLLSLIVPQAGMPAWEWRWLFLFVALLLLAGAFMAGWFNMIADACMRYLGRKPSTFNGSEPTSLEPTTLEATTKDALSLFQSFLPGVAERFGAISMGVLIQGAVVFLLFLGVRPYWQQNAALFEQIYRSGQPDPEMVKHLSVAQQMSLSELSVMLICALLIYAIFSLVTLLWPAFVIYYRDNALRAYGRSIVQFLKDPLRLVMIVGLFIVAQFSLNLLAAGSPSILAVLFQFVGLLLEIYLAVVIFVYVYRVVGAPLPRPASEESKQDAGRDEPPIR